jgi:hypothetical protein
MSHLTDQPVMPHLDPEPGNKSDKIDSPSTTATHFLTQIDPQQRSKWYQYIIGDIYASDDPNAYSQRKKDFIILLVALGGIAGPMSSMMYMPGLLAVAKDLNTTTSAVNGTISAFVVFMGISVSF